MRCRLGHVLLQVLPHTQSPTPPFSHSAFAGGLNSCPLRSLVVFPFRPPRAGSPHLLRCPLKLSSTSLLSSGVTRLLSPCPRTFVPGERWASPLRPPGLSVHGQGSVSALARPRRLARLSLFPSYSSLPADRARFAVMPNRPRHDHKHRVTPIPRPADPAWSANRPYSRAFQTEVEEADSTHAPQYLGRIWEAAAVEHPQTLAALEGQGPFPPFRPHSVRKVIDRGGWDHFGRRDWNEYVAAQHRNLENRPFHHGLATDQSGLEGRRSASAPPRRDDSQHYPAPRTPDLTLKSAFDPWSPASSSRPTSRQRHSLDSNAGRTRWYSSDDDEPFSEDEGAGPRPHADAWKLPALPPLSPLQVTFPRQRSRHERPSVLDVPMALNARVAPPSPEAQRKSHGDQRASLGPLPLV